MTAEEFWPEVSREPTSAPAPAAELVVEFTVRGIPVPKGDLTRGRHGALYNSGGKRLSSWMNAIAEKADQAMHGAPVVRDPVLVDVTFILERPGHHYLPANSKRAQRELRPEAPVVHAGTPDVDKLLRSLADALTQVVIADDKQIADVTARKRYEDPLNVGAIVRIEVLR